MVDSLENIGGLPANQGTTSFKVGAAEKVGGMAYMLQDIQGSLETLLRSPAASYGVFRLGQTLQKHWVDKMKEGGKYTKEQILQIDNLVKRRSGLLVLAAGISAATAQMVKLNLELRRGAIEIGKFTSLKNLPGGAGSPMQAMLKLRDMRLDQQFQFGSAFAGKREDLYKEMYRRMSRVGKKRAKEQGLTGDEARAYEEKLREDLANRFTSYEMGLGLDIGNFSKVMMEQWSGQGMDEVIVNQIIEQLMKASEDLKLDFTMPELAGLTSRLTEQYQTAGYGMEESIANALTLMETLNAEGLELRENQISTLGGLATQFQRLDKQVLLQRFTGIKLEDMQGPGGGVNILKSLQGWVKGQVGARFGEGAELPSFLAMDRGDREFIRGMAEKLGMNEELVVMFNNMQDVGGALMSMADGLDEVRESGQAFSQDREILDTIKTLNDNIEASVGLLDKLSAWFGKGVGKGFKLAGLEDAPAWVMEAINLAAQVGGAYFGGKMILKGATKMIMKTAGGVSAAGIRGAGVIPPSGVAPIVSTKGLSQEIGTVLKTETKTGVNLFKTGGFKFPKGLGKAAPYIGAAITAYEVGTEMYDRMVNKKQAWHEAYVRTGGTSLDAIQSALTIGPRLIYGLVSGKNLMDVATDISGFGMGKGVADLIYGKEGELEDIGVEEERVTEDIKKEGEALVRIIIENEQGQKLGEGVVDPFSNKQVQTVFRIQSTGVLGSTV